jgi:hypothetical protein
MLSNTISGAKSMLSGGLRSGKDIFGLMSIVLSLGPGRKENGFFAHLHRNGIKILFSFIKKAKSFH